MIEVAWKADDVVRGKRPKPLGHVPHGAMRDGTGNISNCFYLLYFNIGTCWVFMGCMVLGIHKHLARSQCTCRPDVLFYYYFLTLDTSLQLELLAASCNSIVCHYTICF